MKILMVTEGNRPDKAADTDVEQLLAKGLADHGEEVSLWTPNNRFFSAVDQRGSFIIFREKSLPWLLSPQHRVSLFPIIKAFLVISREKPDIVHLNSVYWMGLFTMFWAKMRRIPIMSTNHYLPDSIWTRIKQTDLVYNPLKRVTWSYLAWFHNRADFVTAPTESGMKALLDHGLKVKHAAMRYNDNYVDQFEATYQRVIDNSEKI